MIDNKTYKRAWQGRVGSRTVHLNPESFELEDMKYLTEQYKYVTENLYLNNKTIIDYGCGGGLFGIHLFRWEYSPKKYIAIDVANRCINEARLNSMCWESEDRKTVVEIIEIDPIQLIDFKELRAKVFIMLNVVRYFPDMEYTKMFFNKLNNSEIKEIVFNFKLGEKDSFRKEPYKTTYDIGNANELTLKTMFELMNNYDIKKMKKLNDIDDCFVIFKRKIKKEGINEKGE